MSQLRVDSIRSQNNTAAVNFPNGITVTGVVTATSLQQNITGNLNVSGILTASSFYGNGANLSGIDATALKAVQGGSVVVQANPNGVVVTGICTATDFNSTSDVKLKTNINTVENALDIVNKLRGVSFDWKETGNASYGVIAQELEQILPELVSNTDPKTVNYNGIIGVLIEAIKELSDKIK